MNSANVLNEDLKLLSSENNTTDEDSKAPIVG